MIKYTFPILVSLLFCAPAYAQSTDASNQVAVACSITKRISKGGFEHGLVEPASPRACTFQVIYKESSQYVYEQPLEKLLTSDYIIATHTCQIAEGEEECGVLIPKSEGNDIIMYATRLVGTKSILTSEEITQGYFESPLSPGTRLNLYPEGNGAGYGFVGYAFTCPTTAQATRSTVTRQRPTSRPPVR